MASNCMDCSTRNYNPRRRYVASIVNVVIASPRAWQSRVSSQKSGLDTLGLRIKKIEKDTSKNSLIYQTMQCIVIFLFYTGLS